MAAKRGLSPDTYKIMDGNEYKPYVEPETQLPEMTVRAIILGILLGVIFAAANAYLGLKVGMTVTASIPVAVISMGLLRTFFRDPNILENNIVQTVGSAGESLAAGIIFTIPALIMMNMAPSMLTIFLVATFGGILGILMMIPLRKHLIVKEHGALPFPEGTGCSEVLVAGEQGGTKTRTVFKGVGVGFLYKLLMDGHAFGLWSERPELVLKKFRTAIGLDSLPALLGVGFIIGPRIAALMLAGGALAWVGIIPLIGLVGQHLTVPLFPAETLISDMDHWAIWNQYIRYIGAGAVTFGGVISLVKSFPHMVASFRQGIGALRKNKPVAQNEKRTQLDIPMKYVIGGSLLVAVLLALIPQMHLNFLGALLVVIFSFFFVMVSSRVVGLVGGSSLPVSGMTIAALLGTSLIFVAIGFDGNAGKLAALIVGAVVCVAISTAGDISQDLKTGFLLGATPRKQQTAEFFGVLTSAAVIGVVVMVLHESFGIGSANLPAPQATLMQMVVEGVIDQNLPWSLVFIGISIGLVVELLGVNSLPFAVGLYLPLSLSTPIIIGGMIRGMFDRTKNEDVRNDRRENGVLFGSGMIAGEAVMGVLLAFFIFFQSRWEWLQVIKTPIIGSGFLPAGGADILSLVMFLLMTLYLIRVVRRG